MRSAADDPWLRIALLLCPRGFRQDYREQIALDAESSGTPLRAALDVARYGIAVRTEGIVRELRQAVRSLVRAPLFAAVAIGTLALAISVNCVVFAVIGATLLAPLPYERADELVLICPGPRTAWFCNAQLDVGDIGAIRAHAPSLSGVAAMQYNSATLTGHGTPISLAICASSANIFDVLQVRPELGRFFTEADAQPGVRSVVLSNRIWRTTFGADPHILGSTILLDGLPAQVIGVAPPVPMPTPFGSGIGAQRFDAWETQQASAFAKRGLLNDYAFGRRAPGASLADVQTDLARVASTIARAEPITRKDFRLSAVPFAEWFHRKAVWLLTVAAAAVGAVLLIACANVANLVLARGASRIGELAVRSAIGATRTAIVRAVCLEIGVAAAAAAVLGLALAFVELQGLATLASSALPGVDAGRLDWRVVLFTVALVGIATLIAGVIPALVATRRDLNTALKSAARGADASGPKLVRRALAIVELALAFAVVCSSGLLVRSALTLTQTDLGFEPRNVYVAALSLYARRFDEPARRSALVNAAVPAVRALPGVEAVAAARGVPMSFNGPEDDAVRLPGRAYVKGTEPTAFVTPVTSDYFRALGTTLVQGRAFGAGDRAGTVPVAIVDQRFARRVLRGGRAVGGHVLVPDGDRWIDTTIVGLARSISFSGYPPEDDVARIYVPFAQHPARLGTLIIRMRTPDPDLREHVAAAVAGIDPMLALQDYYSMQGRVAYATAAQSANAGMIGTLGIVALLLAIAGVYAILSYSVEQRHHEFGIRIAVGARASDIGRVVIAEALRVGLLGTALGLIVFAFGARSLETLLYAVSPFDPATAALTVLLLLGCAVAATVIPAVRAMRVEPAVALRYE